MSLCEQACKQARCIALQVVRLWREDALNIIAHTRYQAGIGDGQCANSLDPDHGRGGSICASAIGRSVPGLARGRAVEAVSPGETRREPCPQHATSAKRRAGTSVARDLACSAMGGRFADHPQALGWSRFGDSVRCVLRDRQRDQQLTDPGR